MAYPTSQGQVWTWADYKAWVQDMVSAKKKYFYRGQSNPSWKLRTSFHRRAEGTGIDLPAYLNLILPDLHYHISSIQNQPLNLVNPGEFAAFLALLQHHGFPTPILDWTLSPYIGAYFAYRDVDDRVPETDHVKVFFFDVQDWITAFEQPLGLRESKRYVSVLRPYALYNPRLLPQRGAYTVTNVDDIESHVLTLGQESSKTFLYSVLLPVTERTAVMRELSLMGINEMTMFPGMDGLCRAFKEQYFGRDTVGLTPAAREYLSQILQGQKGGAGGP